MTRVEWFRSLSARTLDYLIQDYTMFRDEAQRRLDKIIAERDRRRARLVELPIKPTGGPSAQP